VRTVRITTSATTTVWAESCQLHSLRLVVSGAPTAWTVTVQNKESPAKIFYVSDALNSPATIQVPFPQEGDKVVPVPMINGIDIVTAGTPGVLNAWIESRKAQA